PLSSPLCEGSRRCGDGHAVARVTSCAIARLRRHHPDRRGDRGDREKHADVRAQRPEDLAANAISFGARAGAIKVVVDGAAAKPAAGVEQGGPRAIVEVEVAANFCAALTDLSVHVLLLSAGSIGAGYRFGIT